MKVPTCASQSEYLRVLLEDQDEKLENVKGNELSQKNDFERFSESSFSGYRQGGSQSWNANENFLNSWTPSIFVQIRGGESADHRQSKKQTFFWKIDIKLSEQRIVELCMNFILFQNVIWSSFYSK